MAWNDPKIKIANQNAWRRRATKERMGINSLRIDPDHEMRQAVYWICTIPRDAWEPCQPEGCSYIVGQPERGEETGYLHWQVLAAFTNKRSRRQVKDAFGVEGMHCEPTRSAAAREYVLKEETRDGEQFEFGELSIRRNFATDWDCVKRLAKAGQLDMVPSDIYIRYYRTLRAIASDHQTVTGIEKSVVVYYGPTGTGKSRRAWLEAGDTAYPKDPRSKFWCGYAGGTNIIIDEFRGGIDVSHMLRWLDRYPVRVEIKGSSVPLMAEKIWITSNLHPLMWYPDLDSQTQDALMRRLTIEEMQ